jgi:chromate reductase
MADSIRVLGISGSLRKASFNTALLRAAVERAPAGMTIETADISAIPPFNDDVFKLGLPAPVEKLRAQVAGAQALLIATPEYNFSIPGVLKNAIDWASRPPNQPFAGKPLAIMGASGAMGGTMRAQYHLRQVAVFLDMQVVNKPEIFVRSAANAFDAEGKLIDETASKLVRELLESLAKFVAWVPRLR